MQLLSFLYPALLAGALLLTPVSGAKKKIYMEKDAILLSKVKSLTLRDNAMTSHRRVSAIPQYAPFLLLKPSPPISKPSY